MKVGEFLNNNRDTGDESPQPEEEQSTTSLTPSGIEVLYSWHPKRLYRVRHSDPVEEGGTDWQEVPSVTTVLGVLDKPALTWWGQGVGVEGTMELHKRGRWSPSRQTVLLEMDPPSLPPRYEWFEANKETLTKALVQEKLSTNHVKDKAADRGVSVHSALEGWAVDPMFRPNPENYEEHEQGYIRGLCAFLDDLGEVEGVEAEVMVGSIEHGFAGRYDLRLTLAESKDLVVKTYPKRADKRENVPAGRVLVDLKTSKDCYPTHSLQLAAYELASVECGYGQTDYRAVLHVTEDGRYQFRRATATGEQFLAVLDAYNAMQSKAWFA